MQQETLAQIELQQAQSFEEEYWREKSRIKWLCEGDRNIGFFHKLTKIGNSSKAMSMIRKEDEILDNQATIEHHVLSYFSSLYASSNDCVDNDLISTVVPHSIFSSDNDFLMLKKLKMQYSQ